MGGFESRVLKVGLMRTGQSVFSDGVYTVEIDDQAGGEFVVVRQLTDTAAGEKLEIDPQQWPALRAEIDRMVAECRDN
jgi:hypothetical protein